MAGTSKTFTIHLAKVQAFSQGQQDEIAGTRKRPKAAFLKKYGHKEGEEIWRSYLQGYEERAKFRASAEAIETERKKKQADKRQKK